MNAIEKSKCISLALKNDNEKLFHRENTKIFTKLKIYRKKTS